MLNVIAFCLCFSFGVSNVINGHPTAALLQFFIALINIPGVVIYLRSL